MKEKNSNYIKKEKWCKNFNNDKVIILKECEQIFNYVIINEIKQLIEKFNYKLLNEKIKNI